MFTSITQRIVDNFEMLAYGVAVTDVDGDGRDEIVVCGYDGPNRVLAWRDGAVVDVTPEALADPDRRAIGVAAADVDADGREEIYILNTDTFAGLKRLADRLFVRRDGAWLDAFELAANIESLNLTAGRSVCALDRQGSGRYSIAIANYGGPLRLYEVADDLSIVDVAGAVGMALITGGRGLVAGPIVTDDVDLFCTNENDANFLFANVDATFEEVATGWGVADPFEHGRGVAVVDVDGRFALACGNWEGPHRFWVPAEGGGFADHATAAFSLPSPVRTVIAADFDNDGREEIFFNNIGAANRLFRVDGDEVLETDIGAAAEVDGLGTGAAVVDIDGDGVLELLVAHGESAAAPLTLYTSSSARGNHWVRVRPVTAAGAPARGAVVTVERGERRWRRLVDSGSGYLCQMEPVAHVGLGPDNGPVDRVTVRWPGGRTRTLEHVEVDQEIRVHPTGGG
jgi:hypothetical protein